MLAADRTDVVVTSRIIGEFMIKETELVDIAYRSEVIASVPNYHFLTQKNAYIARRVSIVLETMAKTGRIEEITEETLERIFRYYVVLLLTNNLGAEPHSEEFRQKKQDKLGIEFYDCYGMSEMNGPGLNDRQRRMLASLVDAGLLGRSSADERCTSYSLKR